MERPDFSPVVLNFIQGNGRRQSISSEKAHQWLGWQPQSELEESLRETIAWYRHFFQTEGADPCLFEKVFIQDVTTND